MKPPIRSNSRRPIAAPVLIAALAAVSAQAGTVFVGNSVTAPVGGLSDSVPPFVILGEYDPAGPSATSAITLPTGNVTDVKFYGDNYNFTLYALSEISAMNNEVTFQVAASQSFSGSLPTGTQTLPVTGFSVSAGEMLAFAGIGPYYPQQPNDALNSDATYQDASSGSFIATAPGGPGTMFTVGLNGDGASTYDYVSDAFGNQGRTYAIGVDVATVPDSASAVALFAPALGALAFMKRRAARKI